MNQHSKASDDSGHSPLLIYVVLAFGLCARVLHAVLDDRMIYPDEHFQTLEAANYLVNRIGWLAWEWQMGARNWVVPWLYTPVLGGLRLFGITGGSIAIISCRILMAVVSSVTALQIYRLLRLRGLRSSTIFLTLLPLSFLAPMVVWGVSTFSETWGGVTLWCTLPLIVHRAEDSRARPQQFFIIGVLLGLSVVIRYQMVLWVLPLIVIWIACYRPATPKILWGLAGITSAALSLGLLDWVSWGRPFHTALVYLQVNLVDGLANKHGTSPWYAYALSLYAQFGLWLSLPVGALALVLGRRRQLGIQRVDALVLIPVFIFVAGHCMMAHKELRFISPSFPALFYLTAIVLPPVSTRIAVPRAFALSGTIVLCMALAIGAVRAAASDSFFLSYDMNAAASVLAKDGLLHSEPDRCILLYQSHWIWTRGDMQQNRKVQTIQFDEAKLAPTAEALTKCRYALVFRGWFQSFRDRAGQKWALIYESPFGDGVFRRIE